MTTESPFCEVDLSPARVLGYRAGLRPFRQGSPRLEVETVGSKTIGHNYGHGGSGITMCWGSAAEIVSLLESWLSPSCEVAVLGAGVMGLCTASLLLDAGHNVSLYARDFPPDTTSNVAGGLWAATHVGLDSAASERHDRILRRSWRAFQALDGGLYGVEIAPIFETDDRSYPLDPMPAGLVEPPRGLDRIPFRGLAPRGQVSSTLLIETPRFLDVMLAGIRERGAALEQRVFEQASDLLSLEQSVLVNCLGLGAATVVPDPLVSPIRGQLVLLDPAPRSFMLDHAEGYVISRPDVLILGGTFEEGVDDPRPQEQTCAGILQAHRRFFGQI